MRSSLGELVSARLAQAAQQAPRGVPPRKGATSRDAMILFLNDTKIASKGAGSTRTEPDRETDFQAGLKAPLTQAKEGPAVAERGLQRSAVIRVKPRFSDRTASRDRSQSGKPGQGRLRLRSVLSRVRQESAAPGPGRGRRAGLARTASRHNAARSCAHGPSPCRCLRPHRATSVSSWP